MDANALLEKNKNMILNLGIVILALFISFQIYKGIEERINVLAAQKNDELKKSEAASEITSLEEKIDGLRKVFVKKDLGAVIDTISAIAKKSSVRVASIKPDIEEAHADYIKSSFLITINAPDYHALGDFVSQVESYQDIYIIDELRIVSEGSGQVAANADRGLKINFKISTISYLQ